MKKKIGEIYNKPIVEGDINLKTPNEIHKSELSGGGGNNSSEVKEWYYTFDGPKYAEDNNLKFNGSSEDYKEEMELLNNMLMFICPVYKIFNNETGSLYINYETNRAVELLDLIEKIPFKFNESYYHKMPIEDDGNKGITLIFKGTLEERFQQMNKMEEMAGQHSDLAKYFKPITKEEYYSYLEAKEMDIYEFLEFIGNQ